jgi:hypothetical protein
MYFHNVSPLGVQVALKKKEKRKKKNNTRKEVFTPISSTLLLSMHE